MFSGRLLKLFAIGEDEARGLSLSAGSAFCMLCAYYYLQPLSDTLALSKGLELTPLITVANVAMFVVANPLYSLLVKWMPVESVLPIVYRILAAGLITFGSCFMLAPSSAPLAFSMSVFIGTMSLFLTTTFWARMASVHSKEQSKRLYGIIAAGAQIGQLTASLTAPQLFDVFGKAIVFFSALLIEFVVHLIRWRTRSTVPQPAAQPALQSALTPASEPRAQPTRGGMRSCAQTSFAGVRVLMSTPLLRAITAHTLLMTFVVSGIWYERAAAVVAAFDSTEARYDFFARLNSIVGATTLVAQLLLFSHVLARVGFRGALVAEPAIVMLGLLANCVQPGLLSIALLDGARKIVHYALMKPTKEGLYAALPTDVVFIAKPLLDTLIYRLGSLIGAAYFSATLGWGATAQWRRYLLLAVALVWAVNSWFVGALADAQQRSASDAEAEGGREVSSASKLVNARDAEPADDDGGHPLREGLSRKGGKGGKGDEANQLLLKVF